MAVDYDDPVVKQIFEARLSFLLGGGEFVGIIATQLQLVDGSKWCPTMATDGRHLFYNREFVKTLNKEQLKFIIGHETGHCMFDHIARCGSRDPQLWNMAIDYIVNYFLVKERIGQMPPGGLHSEKYTDAMTSEEVYELLKKNVKQIQMPLDMHLTQKAAGSKKKKDKGEGEDGDEEKKKGKGKGKGEGEDGDEDGENGRGKGDQEGEGEGNGQTEEGGVADITVIGEDGPPDLSDADLDNIRDEMLNAMISASHSVDAGSIPGSILRMIKTLTEPVMDWREMLDLHIKSSFKDDWTYTRSSRRSGGSDGIIFPGQDDDFKPEVDVAIDVSGSISDEMLREFLSEVKGIMEQFDDFKINVWSFDTQVQCFQTYGPENADDIHNYPSVGGGGTMFECNWEFMRNAEKYVGKKNFEGLDGIDGPIEPKRFVMFTDGYPNAGWGEPDYAETLFVLVGTTSIKPPYGMCAYYDAAKNNKNKKK